MQGSWTGHDAADPQSYKIIPKWDEMLNDVQREHQALVNPTPDELQVSPQYFQQQLPDQNMQSFQYRAFQPPSQFPATMQNRVYSQSQALSNPTPDELQISSQYFQQQLPDQNVQGLQCCGFQPPSQFPATMQNQVYSQNQTSLNAHLRANHWTGSQPPERVLASQVAEDTVATAEQRHQQHIQRQFYQQQFCPRAPSQFNPLRMPHSSMFMQTPQQTSTETWSSQMSHVHQTEPQPAAPEQMRTVKDLQEFRNMFKEIRKKLDLRSDSLAEDLTSMYRRTYPRQIFRFEQNDLTHEQMWEMKHLLERWLQDKDSETLRDVLNMLQFSKIFKQRREARGITRPKVASAIGKLDDIYINEGTIAKFEDFTLSFSYMCKLKPLLERLLNGSDCCMCFSQHFATPGTTPTVPVTHRSPNADSSTTSIIRQDDTIRTDYAQQRQI